MAILFSGVSKFKRIIRAIIFLLILCVFGMNFKIFSLAILISQKCDKRVKWTAKVKNSVLLERVGEGRIMRELIRGKEIGRATG